MPVGVVWYVCARACDVCELCGVSCVVYVYCVCVCVCVCVMSDKYVHKEVQKPQGNKKMSHKKLKGVYCHTSLSRETRGNGNAITHPQPTFCFLVSSRGGVQAINSRAVS